MMKDDETGGVIWGVQRRNLYPVRCPLPLCPNLCATMARLRIERIGKGWRVLRASLHDNGELHGIGDDPLSRFMPTREDAEAFAHKVKLRSIKVKLRSIWAGPW